MTCLVLVQSLSHVDGNEKIVGRGGGGGGVTAPPPPPPPPDSTLIIVFRSLSFLPHCVYYILQGEYNQIKSRL